jgi:O-antigen/teichoic acid export membrane protein
MLKRVLNNTSFIYVIGELISKISPFIALPLLTRMLTPESFGLYSVFTICIFFAYILVSLSTISYLPIIYFKNEKDVTVVASNIIFYSLGVSLTVLVLSFSIGFIYPELASYLMMLQFAVVAGFLNTIIQIKLSLLQCKNKALNYIGINIVKSFLFMIFVVTLFFLGEDSPIFYMVAYVLPYFLIVPFVLRSLTKEMGWSLYNFFESYKYKDAVLFGLQSIPSALTNWFRTSFDRFIVVLLIGSAALGLYSAAYQLAFALVVLSAALAKSMSPKLFSMLRDGTGRDEVIAYCNKYFYLLALFSFLYSIFLHFSTEAILGERFQGSSAVAAILTITAFFQGASSFYVGILYYNGNVNRVMYYNVVSLLTHFVVVLFVCIYFDSIFYMSVFSVVGSLLYFSMVFRRVYVSFVKTDESSF